MASNDYYHSFKPTGNEHGPHTTTSYSQEPHTSYPEETYTSYSPRNAQKPSAYNLPPQSPEDDYGYQSQSLNNRPYEHTSSPYTASGPLVTGGRDQDQTAYADNVPLRPTNTKDSNNAYQGHDYGDDPAIIDRPSKKAKKKKGFFARIPWVVYTLTLIQCAVFIAELAKNGESLSTYMA